IRGGRVPGLVIVRQATNVLFDLLLSWLFRLSGADAAQRVAVSLAVLTFAWGAFSLASTVTGRRAWHVMPFIAMLAYGWVFHMGLFNFYLSLGLCFWGMALAWTWRPRRLVVAASLLVLACLAHALPVVWAAGLLVYSRLAGPLTSRGRALAGSAVLLFMV